MRRLCRSKSSRLDAARRASVVALSLLCWLLAATPSGAQVPPAPPDGEPAPAAGDARQPTPAVPRGGESVTPPTTATATDADEAAADTSDRRSQLAPPPWPLVLQWLPLKAQPAATLQRRELRAIAQDLERARSDAACQAAAALLDARLQEASRLFYAPIRKDADLAGIERFLDSWVRGPDPLLVVAAEQWAPAPSWRDTAALACARAARPAIAERFLRPTAGLQLGGRSAVALALLRWRRGGGLATHTWWLAPMTLSPSETSASSAADGAVSASLEGRLLAAILLPDETRRAALARLRADADATQRPLVDAVTVWRGAQAATGSTP